MTKIGQLIASMRTTPQVSGLGPVTVYIARFKCRAGLNPDRAYLFQLGSAHQKVAPGRAHSTRLHCHLFCRAVLDPGRALSICGSVNVAYDNLRLDQALALNPADLKLMTLHLLVTDGLRVENIAVESGEETHLDGSRFELPSRG